MSKIHFLKAKHGDAFILECYRGTNRGVVVVDGGPFSNKEEFVDELNKYEKIDLMVLTHYDDDHIGGILWYLLTCKAAHKPLTTVEMWANCATEIKVATTPQLSTGQALSLANLLDEYVEKQGLIWQADVKEHLCRVFPFCEIKVLSPSEDVYAAIIERLKERKRKEEEDVDLRLKGESRQERDLEKDLEDLVNIRKRNPDLKNISDLANAGSISFILRCDDLSILMLGDSFPQNVESCLRDIGFSEESPLKVDYVKVSHHGSRNNISNSLLDIISCNKFIISTNGGDGKSKHPDRETIANIVCHKQRNMEEKIFLYFNYSMDIIEANGAPFVKKEDMEKYNFEVVPNIVEL